MGNGPKGFLCALFVFGGERDIASGSSAET